MITFNEEERVTPTVARRRIATVQREMKSNKERTEALKLTYQRDKEIFNLSEVNLTSSERIDHSLERQLYRLKEIEKEVKRKSTQQIITDHAVVQFIERVMNFNVQDIRDKIKGLDSTRIKNMEDGSIDREKYSLVVANGVVTTILADGMIDLNPISKSTSKINLGECHG